MKTYVGQVLRREYGNREIEVKAESEGEAKEKILEVAGDYEFSCHDAEYDLDWVKEKETGTDGSRITVEHYGRFFGVYDGGDLVCVTVYKKGANEVKRRLEMGLGKEAKPNEVHEAVGIDDVELGGGQIQRGL